MILCDEAAWDWSEGDRRIDTDRFESSKASQPTRSLPDDCPNSAKGRHFRRLVAKTLVSDEAFRPSSGETPKFRG
jgi:hypothetical protein